MSQIITGSDGKRYKVDSSRDVENLVLSGLIGAATGSALIGSLFGGSYLGGVVGDFLGDDGDNSFGLEDLF